MDVDKVEKKLDALEKTLVHITTSIKEPNMLNEIADLRNLIYNLQNKVAQLNVDFEKSKTNSIQKVSLEEVKSLVRQSDIKLAELSDYLKIEISTVSRIMNAQIHIDDWEMYWKIKLYCDKKNASIPVSV